MNVPEDEWPDLHELWPGGSRILVDIPLGGDGEESKGAAFYVERSGSPRIAVEFSNFPSTGCTSTRMARGCIRNTENTYVNGKTGIYVANANDSFRVTGMGFVYLENALTIYNADALSVHDNFIAECGRWTIIPSRSCGRRLRAGNPPGRAVAAGYSGRP